MDLPTREEFEAVRELASRARLAQEQLEARIAALEAIVAQKLDTPAIATPPTDESIKIAQQIFQEE
jgi:BMFP domain-containing protein YqiC